MCIFHETYKNIVTTDFLIFKYKLNTRFGRQKKELVIIMNFPTDYLSDANEFDPIYRLSIKESLLHSEFTFVVCLS